MNANGTPGAPVLPPIDPGNTFVLQRPRADVLFDSDDVDSGANPGVLYVETRDVDGPADPVWQTAIPATMNTGDTVLVITWRVGPGTLTARLTRDDTVALGRRLMAAGGPAAALVITGPSAVVTERAVEVSVALDGCAVRMRWARKDCDTLGRALVKAAQAASPLSVPGIQP